MEVIDVFGRRLLLISSTKGASPRLALPLTMCQRAAKFMQMRSRVQN
jgi:hypothetical protein